MWGLLHTRPKKGLQKYILGTDLQMFDKLFSKPVNNGSQVCGLMGIYIFAFLFEKAGNRILRKAAKKIR